MNLQIRSYFRFLFKKVKHTLKQQKVNHKTPEAIMLFDSESAYGGGGTVCSTLVL